MQGWAYLDVSHCDFMKKPFTQQAHAIAIVKVLNDLGWFDFAGDAADWL